MTFIGKHITAARGLLGMTQADLAEISSVAEVTIRRFEAGTVQPRPATIETLQRALEDRGIEFMNGGEPGVRHRPSKAKKPGTY
ncbi:helix-turn-helix transcriptional regulator [Haliangium sp. UPWRP_2]|uniref:helix-turn-helix domain-containing protein n=1 Tax=Haliangium sp. UPWRP_2 TaxID=1931276 RepID=UPI000B542544|nr:helix-turn-helix transcriptional regulator [Haliangium sp. UPWRP_2]PSM31595.1 XRE family transcriptional regulator [Haliangium sp. UPWRP_2]